MGLDTVTFRVIQGILKVSIVVPSLECTFGMLILSYKIQGIAVIISVMGP